MKRAREWSTPFRPGSQRAMSAEWGRALLRPASLQQPIWQTITRAAAAGVEVSRHSLTSRRGLFRLSPVSVGAGRVVDGQHYPFVSNSQYAGLAAEARTWTVHPGESISATVLKAHPGDRIDVMPGSTAIEACDGWPKGDRASSCVSTMSRSTAAHALREPCGRGLLLVRRAGPTG
jgi:hypothetical protein